MRHLDTGMPSVSNLNHSWNSRNSRSWGFVFFPILLRISEFHGCFIVSPKVKVPTSYAGASLQTCEGATAQTSTGETTEQRIKLSLGRFYGISSADNIRLNRGFCQVTSEHTGILWCVSASMGQREHLFARTVLDYAVVYGTTVRSSEPSMRVMLYKSTVSCRSTLIDSLSWHFLHVAITAVAANHVQVRGFPVERGGVI